MVDAMSTSGNPGEAAALLAIQELLDGKEWSPDTLAEIADVLRLAGYPVRDVSEPVTSAEVVARGAALLDEQRPGWEKTLQYGDPGFPERGGGHGSA